jgi:hypothetical protein
MENETPGDPGFPPTSLHSGSPGQEPEPVVSSRGADRAFRVKVSLFWLAVAAAIIAAFTFGYPTWQDYMAQDAAKRQLRAYIEVKALGPRVLEAGAKLGVRDTVRNVGRTPAYDKGANPRVTIAEYPLAKSFSHERCDMEAPATDKSKWFVGKMSKPETTIEAPLDATQVDAIKGMKAAIYYHGRVCYRDIFGETHRTDFCMLWKWDAGRFSPALYCDQGNTFN